MINPIKDEMFEKINQLRYFRPRVVIQSQYNFNRYRSTLKLGKGQRPAWDHDRDDNTITMYGYSPEHSNFMFGFRIVRNK